MIILTEQKDIETKYKKGFRAEDLFSFFSKINFATLKDKDIILNGYIPKAPLIKQISFDFPNNTIARLVFENLLKLNK